GGPCPSAAPGGPGGEARRATGRPGAPRPWSGPRRRGARPGHSPSRPESGLDGDVEVTDRLPIPSEVLQPPRGGRDRRPHVQVDGPGPRGVPLARVDLARNGDVEGHDGPPQTRGEVKGPLVEGPDRPRRDALAFGAQVHG